MSPSDKPTSRVRSERRLPALDSAVVGVLFWLLALVVFTQFFTRYVLNDSIGWTEEIARYLLITVTFAGSAIAVRRNTHISVEFFYRYLSPTAGRTLALGVDLLKVCVLGAMTWLCITLTLSTRQMMTSIDVSKSVLYGFVAGCFALMTVYAALVTWRHFKSGKADVSPDATADLGE